MKSQVLLAAAVLAASWVTSSGATPIAAVGTTEVTVADLAGQTLSDLSITATPIEGASGAGANFFFNIVGGNLDTLTVQHTGGVAFDDGTNTLSATNFLIDVGAQTVSANLNGRTDFITIFDLVNVNLSGPITANLRINETLSEEFVTTFLFDTGIPVDLLNGLVFGSASTSPTPVPLPATALLLLAAVGTFWAMHRRKAATG